MKVLHDPDLLFHCFISRLLLKLAFLNLACSIDTKTIFLVTIDDDPTVSASFATSLMTWPLLPSWKYFWFMPSMLSLNQHFFSVFPFFLHIEQVGLSVCCAWFTLISGTCCFLFPQLPVWPQWPQWASAYLCAKTMISSSSNEIIQCQITLISNFLL